MVSSENNGAHYQMPGHLITKGSEVSHLVKANIN